MAAAPATAPNSSTAVGTLRRRRSKRARTANPNCNWRDWANLTAGPAGQIAEQLLADDVTSYLRFRAVCTSWRRCTQSPWQDAHGGLLDSRFHPRRWIMLPEIFDGCTDRRDFFNVSTGERIRVDLPELRHRSVVGPTSDGLLVLLCRKGTGELHLLNPLTKQLTALPNAASLLNNSWRSSTWLSKLTKLQALSAGLADHSSTVALHFGDHEVELAVAKPNDDRWSCRARPEPDSESDSDAMSDSDSEPDTITASLSFENRFYCLTDEAIKAVDVTAAGQRPQLVTVVEEYDCYGILVDNAGELIRVRPAPGSKLQRYEAHRVDLDEGTTSPIYDLRGRAVFVCDDSGRSVSVLAGLCSSISADVVYRCRRPCSRGDGDERGPKIGACHVKNGWITYDLCDVRPGSVVDYLSRYVCRSKDIVVHAPPRHSVRAAASVAGPRKRKASSKVFGNEWVN